MSEQIPLWKPPAAHAAVLVPHEQLDSTDVLFPVINVGTHRLPALIMGIITGRVDGSGTYELSRDDLLRAVEMLTPAEAARMYQQPNISAWRRMIYQLGEQPDSRVFMVFIGSFSDSPSSPYDKALRAQITRGHYSPLYSS